MAAVTGFVEKIKYRNEDNGYSVLDVSAGGEEFVLVGTFPYIGEGEMIEAVGTTGNRGPFLFTTRRFSICMSIRCSSIWPMSAFKSSDAWSNK